jgi:hypothetical protein
MLVNFDHNQIYIQCPRCAFFARPFLRQVRHRETIICGGCKSNLRLEDHLGSYRKAERQMRHALDELAEALKDITITLKL